MGKEQEPLSGPSEGSIHDPDLLHVCIPLTGLIGTLPRWSVLVRCRRARRRVQEGDPAGQGGFPGAAPVRYQRVETFLTHFTCDLLKLTDQNDFQSLCSGLDLKSCPKGVGLID